MDLDCALKRRKERRCMRTWGTEYQAVCYWHGIGGTIDDSSVHLSSHTTWKYLVFIIVCSFSESEELAVLYYFRIDCCFSLGVSNSPSIGTS